MPTPDKIDLFKLHRDEYAAKKQPALIRVKKASYLAVGGRGAPGGADFQTGVGALYAVAFTIKMTLKHSGGQDYAVSKLEGRWWTDGDGELSAVSRDEWNWQLLIRTPDFVKRAELKKAIDALLSKGKEPRVATVGLESLSEGDCVQALHVGPYEREPETVEAMLAFAADEGWQPHGRHHEIYLSDPRRVEPERLKTILRRPVKRA